MILYRISLPNYYYLVLMAGCRESGKISFPHHMSDWPKITVLVVSLHSHDVITK